MATVGLLAYVFVVGWIVDLVKFSAARLPAAAATAALSTRQLFGDGLRSSLLMAAVFAASCAVAYFSSRRNWDVHGQDWHDIVRKHGVANAAADGEAKVERGRRARRHARRKADRAGAVAARSRRLPFGLVHGAAERVQSRQLGRRRGSRPKRPSHSRRPRWGTQRCG